MPSQNFLLHNCTDYIIFGLGYQLKGKHSTKHCWHSYFSSYISVHKSLDVWSIYYSRWFKDVQSQLCRKLFFKTTNKDRISSFLIIFVPKQFCERFLHGSRRKIDSVWCGYHSSWQCWKSFEMSKQKK